MLYFELVKFSIYFLFFCKNSVSCYIRVLANYVRGCCDVCVRDRSIYLLVNVGLGNERVEDVEDAVNVPHFVILLQTHYLLRRPRIELPSELDKRLKLQRNTREC